MISLLPIQVVFAICLCGQGETPLDVPPPVFTMDVLDAMKQLPGGLAPLPVPPAPRSNRQTRAKIELGSLLFFDKRLSADKSISCATCHDPAKAFSDGRKKALGIGQKQLPRRSPSLLNAGYNPLQFWDGRANSLESQVAGPLFSPNEMGLPHTLLLPRLRAIPEYRRRFRLAFGRDINFADMARAVAAFERTLVTLDAPFDRYMRGDKQALSEQQKHGLVLFFSKAECSQCHNGPNFTDNKFYSLGAVPQEKGEDLGRFAVTKNPADRYAFKTPSLRNTTLQSAFMHDGSISTLAEVIDLYNRGGGQPPKSPLLFELGLTPADKEDLLAFLQSLTGRMPVVSEPQ